MYMYEEVIPTPIFLFVFVVHEQHLGNLNYKKALSMSMVLEM